MKTEAYITIYFNGRASCGEAAIAIVFILEGDDRKFIKKYGYSNVSHQQAQALAMVRLAESIKSPVDLLIVVEHRYAHMVATQDVNMRRHKELWEIFRNKMKQMTSVRIRRDPNHKFKQSSILALQKGGYKMEEVKDG